MINRVDPDRLWSFTKGLFSAAGVRSENAELVANALLKADLRGIDSHGVSRIPIYMERLKKGLVNPDPQMRFLQDAETSALIDGDYGLGQITGTFAMQCAVEKADRTGIAIVGVRKSHHFGIAAHFAELALPHDMIGMVCSNTTPLMPPPGGAEKLVGNNPFAFAVPAGEHLPVIFDMACSTVAQGKIVQAKAKGEKIPYGWAVDSEGKPTDDPKEALKGYILPAAGPKGYGLAVIVDLMTGVLLGASFGKSVSSIYNDLDNRQDSAHLFMAVKIDRFCEVEAFKQKADRLISELKNGKKAEGIEEIFLPGEIELKREIRNREEGLSLSETMVQTLQELGSEYQIELRL